MVWRNWSQKYGRTDEQKLSRVERQHDLNWDELHAYADRMEFPECHKNAPVDRLLKSCGDTCEFRFDKIERCLEFLKSREHVSDPFARAVQCHNVWQLFNKCVRVRNKTLITESSRWECEYIQKLTPEAQIEHLEEIDRKVRYLEYCVDKALTEDRKVSIQRQKFFVMDRGIAVRKSFKQLLNVPAGTVTVSTPTMSYLTASGETSGVFKRTQT